MSTTLRKIALLDLDAFFAAVEVLKSPQLAEVPFAVGGGGDRGVVATANYLARRYGVRSAMPGHQARRLCPQLQFVRSDMSAYRDMSARIVALLESYTPLVEKASIDEFYLDLTETTAHRGSATLIMAEIRDQIRALGVTASAGISTQKMVAKIASEESKPDGQFVVPPDQVVAYLAQIKLGRIPGVGPKSQQRLADYGYHKGCDIQHADVAKLQQILGDKAGHLLYERCQGIDARNIVTARQRKQVSTEETLPRDLFTQREVEDFMANQVLPALKKRLPANSWQQVRCKAQTIKLKFSDFEQTTMTRTSNRVSPSLFYRLLQEAWPRARQRGVRLIGAGITLPDPDQDRQLELDLE